MGETAHLDNKSSVYMVIIMKKTITKNNIYLCKEISTVRQTYVSIFFGFQTEVGLSRTEAALEENTESS